MRPPGAHHRCARGPPEEVRTPALARGRGASSHRRIGSRACSHRRRRCSGCTPHEPVRWKQLAAAASQARLACSPLARRSLPRAWASNAIRTKRRIGFRPDCGWSRWSRPALPPAVPGEDRMRKQALRDEPPFARRRAPCRPPHDRWEGARHPGRWEAWAARCQPARPSGARNLDKTPGSQGCCARSGRRSRPLRETLKHRLRQAYSRADPLSSRGPRPRRPALGLGSLGLPGRNTLLEAHFEPDQG
jgi:hypothetical protein